MGRGRVWTVSEPPQRPQAIMEGIAEAGTALPSGLTLRWPRCLCGRSVTLGGAVLFRWGQFLGKDAAGVSNSQAITSRDVECFSPKEASGGVPQVLRQPILHHLLCALSSGISSSGILVGPFIWGDIEEKRDRSPIATNTHCLLWPLSQSPSHPYPITLLV